MWCTTSTRVAPVDLPLFTLRGLMIPKRQWNSWMGDASKWIIPSPNVPIPRHPESTWVNQLIMVVGLAAAGGGETLNITVAMTDMMSMATGTGALRHLTTVDTGLARGLPLTAHEDTNLLLSRLQSSI